LKEKKSVHVNVFWQTAIGSEQCIVVSSNTFWLLSKWTISTNTNQSVCAMLRNMICNIYKDCHYFAIFDIVVLIDLNTSNDLD
jgi:hypothetical protein